MLSENEIVVSFVVVKHLTEQNEAQYSEFWYSRHFSYCQTDIIVIHKGHTALPFSTIFPHDIHDAHPLSLL
jgi:hypothetical protein